MGKAEKFIEEHTKNCSNRIDFVGDNDLVHHPWLSPNEARRAVEIAREEIIDKFCEWVKKNVTYTHPRKGTEECVINLGKLKEAIE